MKTMKKSLKVRSLAENKRLETENVRNVKSLANPGYKNNIKRDFDIREKEYLNISKQTVKSRLKDIIMKKLNWTVRSVWLTLRIANVSYRKKEKI